MADITDPVGEPELKRILESSGFDLNGFREEKTLTEEETIFLVPIPGAPLTAASEILDSWTKARSLVARTGRWPIACGMGDVRGGFSFSFGVGQRRLREANAIEDPMAIVDSDSTYIYDEQYDAEDFYGDPPEVYPGYLVGEVDIEAWQLRTENFTGRDIQRWATFEMLKRSTHLEQPTDHWEEWVTDYPSHIAFVPSPLPWSGVAYVQSYGYRREQAIAVALAKHWYNRYGIEHVAAYGLNDLFIVERPPSDPEEVWDVARSAFHIWSEIELGRIQDGSVLSFAPKLPFLKNWACRNQP